MTTTAIRIYTGVIALICTAAITFALSAHDRSGRWRDQVAYWEDVASRSAHHDRATSRRMRRLARRYNQLVTRTHRSDVRLLRALRSAQNTSAASLARATVYRSVNVASGGAAPTPAPTQAPPPPTTQAS
jgi:hypothetical protein